MDDNVAFFANADKHGVDTEHDQWENNFHSKFILTTANKILTKKGVEFNFIGLSCDDQSEDIF